ncbi:uncharacterized protein UTRI_00598 [Ustilago trichophora]|uniref:Uncharacterized protein n=1 Tax=Ustilago trichophora TaxID=86804 RepID=A0A5C3DV97_9BASI|nr:uncharacterized protein UTRI_00598 [Ustilago trichophora]
MRATEKRRQSRHHQRRAQIPAYLSRDHASLARNFNLTTLQSWITYSNSPLPHNVLRRPPLETSSLLEYVEEGSSCLDNVIFDGYQQGTPIYTSDEEPKQSSNGENLVERAAVDRGDLEGTLPVRCTSLPKPERYCPHAVRVRSLNATIFC